jgi:hypothetical protein
VCVCVCVCVCVRLFCVCVVLCLGSGLATGQSLVQGDLPSVKLLKNKRKPRHLYKGIRGTDKKKRKVPDQIKLGNYDIRDGKFLDLLSKLSVSQGLAYTVKRINKLS